MNQDYQLSFTSKDCIDLIKSKINTANKNIDIELYYFVPDSVGIDILELLIEKSKSGVKIRLLLDSVGSYELSKSTILKKLIANNISIRFFNSIFPFSKTKKSIFFLRNHRRSIIIDDEYLFTGSVCVGQQTIDWAELGISIKDKMVIEYAKRIFNKTWNKTYHPSFKIGSSSNGESSTSYEFKYITQAPLQFQRHIYKHYLKSIKNAQESIYLVSPYFIPDKRFVRYLKKASKRLVDIHIIMPAKTDWLVADLARNTYIHTLLKHNIKIHFYTTLIHSKFAIFDNKEAFIGTMNLDNLGLRYNYECGIIINNKKCIEDLILYTNENLLKNSTLIDLGSWKNRGLFIRIIEKFVWFFRKLL